MIEVVTIVTYLFVASLPPPARFDVPNERMTIQYGTPAEIVEGCGHPLAMACAFRTDYGVNCNILLPHGTRKDSALFRHERAHCNGWPASHGG